jgi:hypothetical protein
MKYTPIFFISLLLFTQAASAKIYKWTDENGQTHYSDVKPQTTIKVEEPLSKTKNVTSDITTADIKKYLIGTWKIPDQTENENGVSTLMTGNATFHTDGKVSFDLTILLNGSKFDGLEMSGRWYITETNHLNIAVTTTVYGKSNTSNNTEIITKINEDIMTSIDEDGKTSTLRRIN